MKRTIRRLSRVAFAAVALTAVGVAMVVGLMWRENVSSERLGEAVNLSGRQRMLSQRVSYRLEVMAQARDAETFAAQKAAVAADLATIDQTF